MKPYFIFFSLLIHALYISSATATRVSPISLEQLSTRASLIFVGQVIDNEVKQDEQNGHIATFTRFKVIDLIKGNANTIHTIKQIGGHHKESKLRMRVHGVPAFTVGNEYVVFLPEKSAQGFSSPLGLHQGSFSIIEKDGERIVSNGRKFNNPNNDDSASNRSAINVPLAVDAQNAGQSYLSDFINSVRAYNVQ